MADVHDSEWLSRNIYMLNEDEDVCWQIYLPINALIGLINYLISKTI